MSLFNFKWGAKFESFNIHQQITRKYDFILILGWCTINTEIKFICRVYFNNFSIFKLGLTSTKKCESNIISICESKMWLIFIAKIVWKNMVIWFI